MDRKLVAAIACRNQGTRLYGKPLQNLDVESGTRVIDHIIACLQSISCIDEIILGISEGVENEAFINLAQEKSLRYVVGDQIDVLARLIDCGTVTGATDIFRVTSESPFLYFEPIEHAWNLHKERQVDATFMDNIIDGCGFEIIGINALIESHILGDDRHRSELCTLFIREQAQRYKIIKLEAPSTLIRRDLRLTVDNPEDLVICRKVYSFFKSESPRIAVEQIVDYLDANPKLIELTYPFTELGYKSMYR